MRVNGHLFWLGFALCLKLAAQSPPETMNKRDRPADAAELAQITARGRAIAAYDQAAWHATDAVRALKPPDVEVGMYVGVQTAHGLDMGFGHMNPDKTRFLLAYEVMAGKDAEHPQVSHHSQAIEDDGMWLHEARAFETVQAVVTGGSQPYNLAILPTDAERWFVYAYPAQTVADVYPTGADARYLVSADGGKIEQVHRMHLSLIEFKASPKGSTDVGTYRTAVVDDAPEDTDVAIVIMMGGTPSLVVCKTFVYQIDASGQASYVAKTTAFLKDTKSKP